MELRYAYINIEREQNTEISFSSIGGNDWLMMTSFQVTWDSSLSLRQVLLIIGSLLFIFVAYFAVRILYGLLTFPDRPKALAELERDLAEAKKFLRSKGIQV